MSTRNVIVGGDGYTLYTEWLEGGDGVYLELENVEFQASNNRIEIRLPIELWEYLRQFPAIDLTGADKSDAELLAEAECYVDDRIARFNSCDELERELVILLGAIPFGAATLPREEQVARGFAAYKQERDHKLAVISAIQKLKDANS